MLKMKAKYLFVAILATMLGLSAAAQPRIAVLDFNAGVGVMQNDVTGLSAIFNTYFSPTGYIVVERTRVSDVLHEQNIQVSSMTEEQRVRLGEILNVAVIVIGDVNYAMQQYNVDVRAVNVETGAIVAKDGTEWSQGTSYREMMKTLAERLSQSIPVIEFYKPPLVMKEKKTDPAYRPTGGSLRFTGGGFDIVGSIAYNYYFTPVFMLGGGVGLSAPGIPVYIETDFRTPRYKWSLFVNVKSGYDFYLGRFFVNFAFGGSYKNLNIGVGVGTTGIASDIPLIGFISYNLPLTTINKLFF